MKTKKIILFFVLLFASLTNVLAFDFNGLDMTELEDSLLVISENIFEAVDMLYLDWIVILFAIFISFHWVLKKILEYSNEKFDLFEEEKARKILIIITSVSTLLFFILNVLVGIDTLYNILGFVGIIIPLVVIPILFKKIRDLGYSRSAYFAAILCYALLVPKIYQGITIFIYWSAIIGAIIVAFMPKKIIHNKDAEVEERKKENIIEKRLKKESHFDRHIEKIEKDMLKREQKELKEVSKEIQEDQRQKKILKNIIESVTRLGKIYFYKKKMHLQATEPKTRTKLEKVEHTLIGKIDSDINNFKISLSHEMKDLGAEMHEIQALSKEDSKEISELHKQEKVDTRLAGLMKHLSDKKTQLSYHKEVYENIEHITEILKENEKKEAEIVKQGLKLVKMINIYISEVKNKIEKQEITGDGNALFYCEKINLLIDEKVELNRQSKELILESEELTKKILRKIKEKENEDEIEINESKINKKI